VRGFQEKGRVKATKQERVCCIAAIKDKSDKCGALTSNPSPTKKKKRRRRRRKEKEKKMGRGEGRGRGRGRGRRKKEEGRRKKDESGVRVLNWRS
jgi:hypothetical protein